MNLLVMIMKKIRTSKHLITLLLLVLCVGVLAACGNDSGGANTGKFDLCFIVDNTVYETVESFSGEKDMPEVPTKDGYSFDGWYYDNGTWKKPFSATDELTENKNVYCKWRAVEYQAKFIADGDVVKTVDFTVNDTELRNIPSVPSKNGYTGEWESYTLGKENIEINAVYTPITYTVTYQNTKGAANTNVSEYTIENETISLGSLSGVDGYTFDGWYDARGNKVQEISKGTTSNLALTAKWTPITYTATFYADGVEVGTATFTVEDAAIKNVPTVPEKSGYSGAWMYEVTNNNIDVYATYTIIEYSIQYSGASGSINTNPTKYTIEDGVIELDAPIDETSDYYFMGWYDTSGNKVTSIKTGSTGNISLSAKWAYGVKTKEDLLSCPTNTNIILLADIDMNNEEWTPLFADRNNSFTAIFDGNGFSISNLKITADTQYAGLIGNNAGTIKNLKIVNISINVTSSASPYAGGIVAYNQEGGLIIDCSVSGNVRLGNSANYSYNYVGGVCGYNNGQIIHCSSSANVYVGNSDYDSYIGGFCGYNYGTIDKCSSTGSVAQISSTYVNEAYMGGFVGRNSNKILNSYSSGSIRISGATDGAGGGFAGSNGKTIENSYCTGSVTVYVGYEAIAGGFCGRNYGDIINAFATGNVSSTCMYRYLGCSTITGGLVGSNSGNITNCYRYMEQAFTEVYGSTSSPSYYYEADNSLGTEKSKFELQNGTIITSMLGWDTAVWEYSDNAYPTLK